MKRTYIAIDLKSFYASVECVERGLDPLTTNLVVADSSRTEKTICLAVSPSLKSYGVPGRARLFEVVERVNQVNARRQANAPGHRLIQSSVDNEEIKKCPHLALDYIAAPPQMAKYMAFSARIYQIYLRHVSPEDIHVYSIDEVFIDATDYLPLTKQTPRQFAMKLILEVLTETGITATAGIGTNLYLCKVALDIVAKHIPADENGVRVAELDEMSYRKTLWSHRPITDFWRVGPGYAKKLEAIGLTTMGDIARCSVGFEDWRNEDTLYQLFGVNAQLLIDHAWGWEPCTIAHIKAYTPRSNSLGSGQVLQCPYPFEKAKLVVWEMADQLSLDLVAKGLVTDQLTLTVGYDIESLTPVYAGAVTLDHYGRKVPKHAHGTHHLPRFTASSRQLTSSLVALFDAIVNPALLVRRLNITAEHILPQQQLSQESGLQLDLFSPKTDDAEITSAEDQREYARQKLLLEIKNRYGKNAILKGKDFLDGATTLDRNRQIGGHRA